MFSVTIQWDDSLNPSFIAPISSCSMCYIFVQVLSAMGLMQNNLLLGNSTVAAGYVSVAKDDSAIRTSAGEILLLEILLQKVYQRQSPGKKCQTFALLKTGS